MVFQRARQADITGRSPSKASRALDRNWCPFVAYSHALMQLASGFRSAAWSIQSGIEELGEGISCSSSLKRLQPHPTDPVAADVGTSLEQLLSIKVYSHNHYTNKDIEKYLAPHNYKLIQPLPGSTYSTKVWRFLHHRRLITAPSFRARGRACSRC